MRRWEYFAEILNIFALHYLKGYKKAVSLQTNKRYNKLQQLYFHDKNTEQFLSNLPIEQAAATKGTFCMLQQN